MGRKDAGHARSYGTRDTRVVGTNRIVRLFSRYTYVRFFARRRVGDFLSGLCAGGVHGGALVKSRDDFSSFSGGAGADPFPAQPEARRRSRDGHERQDPRPRLEPEPQLEPQLEQESQ